MKNRNKKPKGDGVEIVIKTQHTAALLSVLFVAVMALDNRSAESLPTWYMATVLGSASLSIAVFFLMALVGIWA